MWFGLGTFVMFVSIVSIVVILSPQKSSMKTALSQNDLTTTNASSSATSISMTLNDSKSRRQLTSRFRYRNRYGRSWWKRHRPKKPSNNDDWMTRHNFSRAMCLKAIDDVNNGTLPWIPSECVHFADAAYGAGNEETTFSSTISQPKTENEGT